MSPSSVLICNLGGRKREDRRRLKRRRLLQKEEGHSGQGRGLRVPRKLEMVQLEEKGVDTGVLIPGKDREAGKTMRTIGDERVRRGEEEEMEEEQ